MFTPAETFIGLRYTRAKRRSNFASLISLISMIGIALGIAALITVVSIMNGFETELRERILGMTAHITVKSKEGALTEWREVSDTIASTPQVTGVAPFIRREGLLTHYGNVHGSAIRGIVPRREAGVAVVAEHMDGGTLDALEAGTFNIVLGRGLANMLEARIGDRIAVVVPEPLMTPAGMLPRMRRFRVAGIFEMGIHEYDTALALINIQDAARLFRIKEGVSGLRLKLRDPFSTDVVKREIFEAIAMSMGDAALDISDWTETHVNFFRALKTEKIVMFLILALVVGVAAFNMVSTLVMVVTDKRADVAILRTLGMSAGRVMKVFFIQGAVIGLVGISVGVVTGVVLALNVESIVAVLEQTFGFKFLSPDVYYVSDIPSELHAGDILLTTLLAGILCLGAPLYPAWLAGRTRPAEALRYE
jgi:lipoprotein-releasing system permease protein